MDVLHDFRNNPLNSVKYCTFIFSIFLFFSCTQKQEREFSNGRVYQEESFEEWDARTRNDSVRKALEASRIDIKSSYKKFNKPLADSPPLYSEVKIEVSNSLIVVEFLVTALFAFVSSKYLTRKYRQWLFFATIILGGLNLMTCLVLFSIGKSMIAMRLLIAVIAFLSFAIGHYHFHKINADRNS